MARGIKHAQRAAHVYLNAHQHSQACTLAPVSLCVHPDLPGFAASPDRLLFHDGVPAGLPETKCPVSRHCSSSIEPEHRLRAIMQLACQSFSCAHAERQWQWVDVCYWHHRPGSIVVHRIHCDTATRREWQQAILPHAAFLYSRQLAPALQQGLSSSPAGGL